MHLTGFFHILTLNSSTFSFWRGSVWNWGAERQCEENATQWKQSLYTTIPETCKEQSNSEVGENEQSSDWFICLSWHSALSLYSSVFSLHRNPTDTALHGNRASLIKASHPLEAVPRLENIMNRTSPPGFSGFWRLPTNFCKMSPAFYRVDLYFHINQINKQKNPKNPKQVWSSSGDTVKSLISLSVRSTSLL